MKNTVNSIRERLHSRISDLAADLMKEERVDSGDLDVNALLDLEAVEKTMSNMICDMIEANYPR